MMRAVPEVKETVNLAQQYVNLRYDPQVLMHRLAEIVCHDSFTEMHAFKHHQAIVEEFRNTREPWRSMHLVRGLQAAAVSFGKNMDGLRGHPGTTTRRVTGRGRFSLVSPLPLREGARGRGRSHQPSGPPPAPAAKCARYRLIRRPKLRQ